MSKTVVVISDLHLGRADDFDIFAGPRKCERFIGFMKTLDDIESPVELVINGDFVDFLQLKPWDVKVDRNTAATKIQQIVLAYKDTVFQALGEFLGAPDHFISVLMGNHDVELAFPEVWKYVADAIVEKAGEGTGASGRLVSLALEHSRISYLVRVGGVHIHIEHGNIDDRFNGMNYTALFRDAERGTSDFGYPPGTKLVYDIMNRHKAGYRFVDLLKPEMPAVPLLLLAFDPTAVVDVPGIGLKLLSGLGNGFVGWLRYKITGASLGAGEKDPSLRTAENRVSEDMAAAYQDALGAISQAEAILLQRFFESSGQAEASTTPVFGPKLDATRKKLARAAIRSLGRPDDLRDSTEYYLDHESRKDAQSALNRLTGDVKAVIYGHTHRPLKSEFKGRGLYINSGAWANQITLPLPDEDIGEWMSRVLTNDDFNRSAFPTYIVLAPDSNGVTVSLNVWEDAEGTLWKTHIPA